MIEQTVIYSVAGILCILALVASYVKWRWAVAQPAKGSNKQRTIKAHRELAKRYRSLTGNRGLGFQDKCPLCEIHWSSNVFCYPPQCTGCPMASESLNMGCVEFSSYKIALSASKLRLFKRSLFFLHLRERRTANLKRADFHERVIPILEQLPESCFTKEGGRYFPELIRTW